MDPYSSISDQLDKKGLRTQDALRRLHSDLKQAITEEESRTTGQYSWLSRLIQPYSKLVASDVKNQVYLFRLTSAVTLLLCCISSLTSYLIHATHSYSTLPYEILTIAIFIAANTILTQWDMKLRLEEFPLRAKWLLQLIQNCIDTCTWDSSNYPHILNPLSPSITLQLTLRDGALVNLPWALLVKDDVILLRPGQVAPGKCRTLQPGAPEVLEAGQVYAPSVEGTDVSFQKPQLRKPLSCVCCVMEETPYVHSLTTTLREALHRPVGIFTKDKHVLFTLCFEYITVPIVLVGLMSFNAMRYLYASRWLSTGHWTEMLLLQPFAAVLPLLPLVLPAVWLIVNAGGMAWILALFYTARQFKVSSDPFEEAEVTSPTHASLFVKLREMKHHFCGILQSRGKSPFRTENLVQTLASVTALCCVDKKGILSWPNPTAEKVFFLRNARGIGLDSHTASSAEESTLSDQSENPAEKKKKRRRRECSGSETKAEVLDLSHDYSSPFRLQFDDPAWQNYISSLKPLGLSILLNTCNEHTQEKYAQFCAHLSCHALHHEDLVPVTNRRLMGMMHAGGTAAHSNDVLFINPTPVQIQGCLCELAKQIGFLDGAEQIFNLKDLFFSFRHADTARKDRLARSLSYPKLKFPFPHMVGVAVQETISGGMQLMSQGTGEILLDACVDFWDGTDLRPLNVADRKKILDFYHRTSLTAYCTAFAYSPLRRTVYDTFRNSTRSSDLYMELPADSAHLYQPQRSPTLSMQWDSAQQSLIPGQQHNYFSRSTDSLRCPLGPTEESDPADALFRLQCNQTFVAMVTMQYQARTDMVQLIEQLDKACIRFVHFSKENELRSRVFSEKMGLESGWNCHISLLGDQSRSKELKEENETNRKRLKSSQTSVKGKEDCDGHGKAVPLEQLRPLSVSAPSAINVEVAQVKFEDEISLHSLSNNETEASGSADCENEGLLGGYKRTGSSAAAPTPSPCRRRTSSSTECSLSSNSSSSVLLHVSQGFGEGGSSCWDVNLSRSQSHVTESTEQSAPVAFDMSNRAKLPRGIEEIRPHIESVDNVPLLVSLFTDCTPDATREMVKIMQDYGEVVCVVGSSASAHNASIFMQADASLAVEPLYPQVCQKIPAFSSTGRDCPSPVELSRRMNSLPCSLSFHRDELPSLLHLVLESRHFGLCLRNMMQFWAAAAASLTLVQVLSALLFLPPIFTTGQVLWLSSVTIPLLAVSLFGAPTDPHIMSLATGKNQHTFDKETVTFVLWSYGLKFIPSLGVLLLCYGLTLGLLCDKINPHCSAKGSCLWVYPLRNDQLLNATWAGWDSSVNAPFLCVVRSWISVAFVIYLVVISMTFVHRTHHFWKRSPFQNKLWTITSVAVIVLQAVHFIIATQTKSGAAPKHCAERLSFADIPVAVWCIAALWPLLLAGFNEIVKRQEMKVNVRLQKRARLEFGTKLGMNSPF